MLFHLWDLQYVFLIVRGLLLILYGLCSTVSCPGHGFLFSLSFHLTVVVVVHPSVRWSCHFMFKSFLWEFLHSAHRCSIVRFAFRARSHIESFPDVCLFHFIISESLDLSCGRLSLNYLILPYKIKPHLIRWAATTESSFQLSFVLFRLFWVPPRVSCVGLLLLSQVWLQSRMSCSFLLLVRM